MSSSTCALLISSNATLALAPAPPTPGGSGKRVPARAAAKARSAAKLTPSRAHPSKVDDPGAPGIGAGMVAKGTRREQAVTESGEREKCVRQPIWDEPTRAREAIGARVRRCASVMICLAG
jgi:hypothetical protein